MILGINTVTEKMILAVAEKNKALKNLSLSAKGEEAENFLPSLKKILEEANLKFDQIEKIVVVSGPGPFTAVRVGVSAANILAYLNNIELVSLNTFEYLKAAIGKENKDNKNSLLLLSSGKNEFFLSESKNPEKTKIIKISAIKDFLEKNKKKYIKADLNDEHRLFLRDFLSRIDNDPVDFSKILAKIHLLKKHNSRKICLPTYFKKAKISKRKTQLI